MQPFLERTLDRLVVANEWYLDHAAGKTFMPSAMSLALGAFFYHRCPQIGVPLTYMGGAGVTATLLSAGYGLSAHPRTAQQQDAQQQDGATSGPSFS